MKKFLAVIVSVALAAMLLLSGCFLKGEKGETGPAGRDGINGQDVSIIDIYNEAKQHEGNENLTFNEFLQKYLNYTNVELDKKATLQAIMNKSLMSGVSIVSRFSYGSGYYGTSHKAFTGSGVIIDMDKTKGEAWVVTNCHVVYDDTSRNTFADEIYLFLYGQDLKDVNYSVGTDYSIKELGGNYKIPAQVVGASVDYDIALLKVTDSAVLKSSNAVKAEFANDEHVYVGETVYTVGNAASEGLSVSDGIISKDSEYINVGMSDAYPSDTTSFRVLRTSAAVNHGNSGGGLFNTKGEIIAVVNAKDDEADTDNLGYALPASNVKRLVQLMRDTYEAREDNTFVSGVRKAYLNVTLETVSSTAIYNTETERAEITEGVMVSYGSGQPALSYLQYGDLITNIKVVDSANNEKENVAVTRRYTVGDVMFSVREGYSVILTVKRGQSEIELEPIVFNSSYFKNYN
ncbi:MAG: S1C family serine protease [Clostridia bacterium]|nr:S1C family serine protease [Clostridia bacterium]